MDFIHIFLKKLIGKPFQIQNFRILEPLVDFIFNFEVYNLWLKTFKKALSEKKIRMESRERAFWKFLVMNLQTLKFNIKSMSGSKILKFWIFSENSFDCLKTKTGACVEPQAGTREIFCLQRTEKNQAKRKPTLTQPRNLSVLQENDPCHDRTWCPTAPVKISAQYLNPIQFYNKM